MSEKNNDKSKNKSQNESKKANKSTLSNKKGKEKTKSSFLKLPYLIIIAVVIIIAIIGIYLFISGGGVAKAQLVINSGTVQIKHEGGSWIDAQNGMNLYQSDSIKTGDNTDASVILFESSIIRLDNNTEIMLKELIVQDGKTSVVIQQDAGRTWNSVKKISGIDEYDVQTPSTVASIRGTSFLVEILPNGSTYIGVGLGLINVTSFLDEIVYEYIDVNTSEAVIIDPNNITEPLSVVLFIKDEWVLENEDKDNEFFDNIKDELYSRIEQYIPELKQEYGITDEELDILLDGYVKGYYDLPSDTPQWIRDIIELS